MPRQFLPKKSGEHRIACFALYRALLEQCPRLQSLVDTLPGQSNQLQHLVRKQFRRNRHDTSHRLVVIALQKGYEAEELLRTAGDGDSTAQTKVKDILLKLEEEREKSRKANAGSPKVPREKPRMWPYPGYTSTIFKRPLPKEMLSGRRHVPVMSSANVLPLLRIKKPQPEFLSRIIRNKIEQRQRRNDNISKMDDEYSWAVKEDAWDRIVANTNGERGGKNWRDAIMTSRAKIEKHLALEQRDVAKTASKLLKITNKEKELWAKERREHLRSKSRDARDRKLNPDDRLRKSPTASAQRDGRDQAGKEAVSLQQELEREDNPVESRMLPFRVVSTQDSPLQQKKQGQSSTWTGESQQEEAPNPSSRQVRRAVRKAPIWRSKPGS